MTEVPTRTVERALALLTAVADADEGVTLAEAARAVELSASTSLRLLRTLEANQFISRDADGAFVIGPRLLQIAGTALGASHLHQIAARHLAELVEATGESAYLAVKGPDETAVYVRQLDSPRAIRHVGWTGRTLPLEGTAIGAALRDRAPNGYVSTRSTLDPDATAVAAPIRGPDASVIAALSVVGPTFRIADADVTRFGALVSAHAEQISHQLAGEATPSAVTARQ